MVLPKADVVLKNGRIFQGLQDGFVEALAVWKGRVLAAGKSSEIEALVGPATRVIDLAGRCATPGINDGHQHLLPFGMGLRQVDLSASEVKTLDEVLARVKAFVDKAKPGEWIFGGRYDHFHLDVKRHPFREELDKVSPNNPVYIKRTCGHMGVANSMALKLAGIDEKTPQPTGGFIETQNGRLTGLMQERAQELVTRAMPPLPIADLVRGIEEGGNVFRSYGITSVMDAGVGLVQGYDHYLAYQEARRQRRLPVRTYMSLTGGPAGVMDKAFPQGLMTGVGDEYLKVGSVKLFTDGSAGGKTAAMRHPYKCSCGSIGIFIYSDGELNDWVEKYNALGYQLSIHAIGDAAIDQAVNAVEAANAKNPVAGKRHRVEHCGFTTPDQIAAMKRLGMIPAPQPIFIYEFGDLYIEVLGEERPAQSYPMKDWIEAGLHPIASSDSPVSDFNPMKNLYEMVTRKTDRGTVMGADQCITTEQAISTMTYNGAYGSFSEHVKGTLAPGMLADIAVFDRDLFAVAPEDILPALADITLIDGEIVHDRKGEVLQ